MWLKLLPLLLKFHTILQVNQKINRGLPKLTKCLITSPWGYDCCSGAFHGSVWKNLSGRKWSSNLCPKEKYWEMCNNVFYSFLKSRYSLYFKQCWFTLFPSSNYLFRIMLLFFQRSRRNISLSAYFNACLGWVPVCFSDVFIFPVLGEEIQSLLRNFTFVLADNVHFVLQSKEYNTTIRYTFSEMHVLVFTWGFVKEWALKMLTGQCQVFTILSERALIFKGLQ